MPLTKEILIQTAIEFGFDLIGFSKADILVNETEQLEEWLTKGYHADMHYMEGNIEKRKDVKEIFPNAKTVISLALNYYTPEHHTENIITDKINSQQNHPTDEGAIHLNDEQLISEGFNNNEYGKISRYARGKDYHLVIWEKLNQMIIKLNELDPSFEAYTNVDTGPVMDKAWAVKCGIGWQGKHSNIINREIGSWFFISTIICNIDLEPSALYEDFCGSCTACIDACPTKAIVQDYVVDSNKCISYHTIENKNDLPEELKGKFENWIFGCDICQDVCPWNKSFSVTSSVKEFHPINKEILLSKAINMEQDEFSALFRNSSVKRAKLKGIKRNAKFLLESKA